MPLHFISHGSDLDGQIAMAECRICGYDIWPDDGMAFYMKYDGGDDIVIEHVFCHESRPASSASKLVN